MRFSEYIFLFVLFAHVGWILEVIFRSFRAKTFVNPGFLRGPYLPIYGIGAITLTFCATHLRGESFLIKGLVYLLVTTGLEFITGFIFEKYLHIPLWDYSDQRLKIKNYVCLQFSVYWLILAFALEYLILPLYTSCLDLLKLVTPHISTVVMPSVIFTIVLSGVMLIDVTIRFVGIIWGLQEKEKLGSNTRSSEFMGIARALIETPQVQRLADFNHHFGKTRLDHSMEVAWYSFLLSKKLSLDCNATVRGALLHDLFFYDWLREEPRLHGFRHPQISLKNAREITILSKKETDIIVKHMWPLTVIPPSHLESWIVCFVDTFCTLRDYGIVTKKKLKGLMVWD